MATLTPRRAGATLLLALLGALLVLGLVGEAERSPSSLDGLPEGADSTTVVELQDSFPSGEDSTAVVVYAAEDGRLDEGVVTELRGQLRDIAGDRAPFRTSEDGTAALGVVSVDAAGAEAIATAVEDLRERLREDLPTGVSAQVTGPAAIQADLAAVFDGANLRLLIATASVVALLLIVTYRSPFLWIVPLAVVGIADRVAAILATQTLAAFDVTWDESTIGILSVLVFGAGTDYALLLISRYRDELKVHESRYDAMARALRRTAEAVLASSVTVVVGVLTLLLASFPATRGLGVASAVGIVVAAVSVLGVLPSALVLLPRGVFWPLVPRVGQTPLVGSRSVWSRVGAVVSARPSLMIVVTMVVLAGLAAGLGQVRTGLSDADQFLEKPEAIEASERLGESFPVGSADPTVVVSGQPVGEVQRAVGQVDGVTPGQVSQGEGGLVRVDLLLAAEPGSEDARASIERLRAALDPLPATYVGGPEAESLDEAAAASRDRLVVFPVILGLVLLALVLLLRSLVAPVILVASVVATYLAALGVSWWVFTGVLGFERIDVGMPLLAFLFLVSLGVDYNIFLVTRAAEESREHGTRAGMLRALTATGGVITSAGILLAAVFAVLGVLPLVVLAQLGVVICVGVLLDTLVVRTVLVPAIAVRMGDAFWWPRRLHADAATERVTR
ncbi:MMPL family transporter [Nocardioides donggukensis]|uniref:MMPL family transporter n=1 Tax=Nocardioides donggukensis TaxID=2774019 RepID=A0A927K6N4_9ACTN|nr:MMPL family transporter [Nocardioides donggukensis]MBD8869993.1 MMPL family transporter [Nocardioides donggukensis]